MTSTKVRPFNIEDIRIKTQGLKETWCFLSTVKCLARLEPSVKLGKVGIHEAGERWIVNSLTYHLEEAGLSLADKKMLLGRKLDIPSTGYKMTSKYNLTRMP